MHILYIKIKIRTNNYLGESSIPVALFKTLFFRHFLCTILIENKLIISMKLIGFVLKKSNEK